MSCPFREKSDASLRWVAFFVCCLRQYRKLLDSLNDCPDGDVVLSHLLLQFIQPLGQLLVSGQRLAQSDRGQEGDEDKPKLLVPGLAFSYGGDQ